MDNAKSNDHTEIVLLLDPAAHLAKAAIEGDLDALSDALAKGLNVDATDEVSATLCQQLQVPSAFALRPRRPPLLLPRPGRRR